ncbi:MAG TPA: short-chain dehydrogenase, partial [Sphaerochaeta sp.]|nr:short-chain dehydrogenase [Sphaerochaeta sp.]
MNVLITGASGGLGRALTIECARRGYHLFLTDINKTGLESLRNGVERQFPVVVATMACDLTDDTDVDRLLAHLDTYGIQFDMLLNVAGLDFDGGFLEQSRKNVLTIVSLNICATLRITHAILSRRAIGKSFSLVFVSSLASQYPIPLKATYAASKR